MADTFGAATMKLMVNPHALADDSLVNEEHIPWSDTNVFQLGGRLVTGFEAGVRFASEAEEDALRALVGTQATLTYDVVGGTETLTAILKSLTRSTQLPSGVRLARAAFRIVT